MLVLVAAILRRRGRLERRGRGGRMRYIRGRVLARAERWLALEACAGRCVTVVRGRGERCRHGVVGWACCCVWLVCYGGGGGDGVVAGAGAVVVVIVRLRLLLRLLVVFVVARLVIVVLVV